MTNLSKFLLSFIVSTASFFLPYSHKGIKFYFGFPFKFFVTTKEIFTTNRFYFFNPIFTLHNALIIVPAFILNILSYYLIINLVIKILNKKVPN